MFPCCWLLQGMTDLDSYLPALCRNGPGGKPQDCHFQVFGA